MARTVLPTIFRPVTLEKSGTNPVKVTLHDHSGKVRCGGGCGLLCHGGGGPRVYIDDMSLPWRAVMGADPWQVRSGCARLFVASRRAGEGRMLPYLYIYIYILVVEAVTRGGGKRKNIEALS